FSRAVLGGGAAGVAAAPGFAAAAGSCADPVVHPLRTPSAGTATAARAPWRMKRRREVGSLTTGVSDTGPPRRLVLARNERLATAGFYRGEESDFMNRS